MRSEAYGLCDVRRRLAKTKKRVGSVGFLFLEDKEINLTGIIGDQP